MGATGPVIIPIPSDFPVQWDRPTDAELLWTLDPVHWPGPMTPLVYSVLSPAVARALTMAAHAYERPVQEVLVRRINTYRYQATVPLSLSPEEAAARRARSQQKLREAMGRLAETWLTEWLPEVQAHLAYWDAFDLQGAVLPALLDHLDETVRRMARLWEVHFLLAAAMRGAISEFGKLYRDLFEGSTLEAYRLLQGFDNETLAAGRALHALGNLARDTSVVQHILQDQALQDIVPSLEDAEEARDFVQALRAYLDTYGQCGERLGLDLPTWVEEPAPVLLYLRDQLAGPAGAPAQSIDALAAERELLVSEARESLKGYPQPAVEEFEFLLRAAQEAVVLSENHNLWIDARGMYRVRRVLLEFGHRLMQAGVLDVQADIFYLNLDELRQTAASLPEIDTRALVAERRAEMDHFRSISPPPALGTRPSDARAKDSQKAPDGSSDTARTLTGKPGSSGVARGHARMLRCLADAEKLGQGEILVAASLAPAWTPLFSRAAAVVTDTGGILSHGAIVAREYRIPAVVDTGVATSALQDGQLVEVDGDHGTVRLLSL